MTGGRDRLTGAVRTEDGSVVVTVAGAIGVATVAQFRGLLDEATAGGTQQVTVDMAGIEFCEDRGIAVLLVAAQRLRSRGARLSVRAAPGPLLRLFEIQGLTGILGVEPPGDSALLVRGLAKAAEVPLVRHVLDAALQLVVTMAQAVVAGADGVSITLPRGGRLGTVAASNDVVLEMDHDQYDTGEGPCLDAATQGKWFQIESLLTEHRWPAFVPRARARGIESILSTPLLTADVPIGAMNVYSRAIGAFSEHEKEWTKQFAAEASAVVSSADTGQAADSFSGQLTQGLLSREVITLAQGVVMRRDGVSAAGAFTVLRQISRRSGRPMREVCAELIDAHTADAAAASDAPGDGSAHGPARQ